METIVDAAGSAVVEYGYDAWGKNIYTKGSKAEGVGKDNPFRYRGYVYDEETGLYYLRSRYYDPEWGRFLNADVVLGSVGGLLSHNLFVYCYNEPRRFTDSNGRWPTWDDVQNVFCWLPRQMWQIVIGGLNSKGYKHSATLLNHSLQNNPPDLVLKEDSELTKSIRNNNQYKTKFNEMAKKIMAGENVTSDSFGFTDIDLFGALHNVDITVTGKKIDGEWGFDVHIHDRYDFAFQWTTYFDSVPMFFITTGNNMAWSDQFFGVVQNYDIDIYFREEGLY